jgi:hypothetical protein
LLPAAAEANVEGAIVSGAVQEGGLGLLEVVDFGDDCGDAEASSELWLQVLIVGGIAMVALVYGAVSRVL